MWSMLAVENSWDPPESAEARQHGPERTSGAMKLGRGGTQQGAAQLHRNQPDGLGALRHGRRRKPQSSGIRAARQRS